MTHERERLRDMLRRALHYIDGALPDDGDDHAKLWHHVDSQLTEDDTRNLQQQILAELARA